MQLAIGKRVEGVGVRVPIAKWESNNGLRV
jgi:hypothetical protein